MKSIFSLGIVCVLILIFSFNFLLAELPSDNKMKNPGNYYDEEKISFGDKLKSSLGLGGDLFQAKVAAGQAQEIQMKAFEMIRKEKLKEAEKFMEKSIKFIDKADSYIVNVDETLIIEINLDKKIEKIKEMNAILNNIIEEIHEDPAALENLKLPDFEEIQKMPNNNNFDTEAMMAPGLGGNGGKPGMENGSGQVTIPQGMGGNSCSKMHICKINCGEEMIDDCGNIDSINSLYELLQCVGACTKYNIVYGCGIPNGCDQPCWQDYDSKCSVETYESCINECEEDFGDC